MEKETVFECTIKAVMCEKRIEAWREAGFEVTVTGEGKEGVCQFSMLSPVKNLSDVHEDLTDIIC